MLKRLLSVFFHHLYHSLAWSYDLVAWTVSLGRWNQWGNAVIDLLIPGLILELGFGPGHLQKTLTQRGLSAIGLDESRQMVRAAHQRTPSARLVHGLAEAAPLASASFPNIVAVFPSPYIFKAETASQIVRLLSPGGQLVILLAARPAGRSLPDRLIRGLFRLTGETPSTSTDFSQPLSVYSQAGLPLNIRWYAIHGSELLLLTGNKSRDILLR